MGLRAYDTDISATIEAKNAVPKDKGKYLCPYSACLENHVAVFLRQNKLGNTFVSYNKHEHDINCDFPTSYDVNFHNKKIVDFTLEELYLNIINSNETTSKSKEVVSNVNPLNVGFNEEIVINTISKLYKFCMSNDLDYKINDDVMVGDLLLSYITAHLWIKRKRDYKDYCYALVVGRTIQFFNNENRIRLEINENLKVSLLFNNNSEYTKVMNKLNKYTSSTNIKLLIFGILELKDYTFVKDGRTITFKEFSTTISEKNIKYISKKRCYSSD